MELTRFLYSFGISYFQDMFHITFVSDNSLDMCKGDELTCNSFKMRNTLYYFNLLNIPIIVIRESEDMGNARYHSQNYCTWTILWDDHAALFEISVSRLPHVLHRCYGRVNLRAVRNATLTVRTRLKHLSSNNKGRCFAPSCRNVLYALRIHEKYIEDSSFQVVNFLPCIFVLIKDVH